MFFVPARKIFSSRAGTKKFTRHVFTNSKHKNSRAQTDRPRDDASCTFGGLIFHLSPSSLRLVASG
ncbi:DUF1661 domain-containing protein [Porphyromonas gulae]|uniref:DUF1661 domain-containing protein n=1 Tax=Porphyromonas gulae TaxID=111105 RepID=UPI0034E956A1